MKYTLIIYNLRKYSKGFLIIVKDIYTDVDKKVYMLLYKETKLMQQISVITRYYEFPLLYFIISLLKKGNVQLYFNT